MLTTTPTNTDPREAELTRLRARVETLEEELFDERLAYAKLREQHEQLEEASIGATDTRDQLHRVQRYLMARGVDYQAVSAGRIQ